MGSTASLGAGAISGCLVLVFMLISLFYFSEATKLKEIRQRDQDVPKGDLG